MDFPAELLFKLVTKLVARRAVEPVVAFICLYFTLMFIEVAGTLGDGHRLLYWLCTVIAIATGMVGLGSLGLYLHRLPWRARVDRAGSKPAPD